MNLAAMADELSLGKLTPELPDRDGTEITAGYASDLLSDVLAHAAPGGVLITAQVHLNVVAVAAHVDLAAIIFSSDRTPEDAVRERAVEEGIALFTSDETTFDIAGRLYALGLRGTHG
ncbi:MAG: serine kinase [Candidatus Hydrogenedentes bacterium]|nr:serine kinase [Candidatus Hydrogenedentota bacterium]